MGWTRLGNGALLRHAAAEFHAVLTADQHIEFQQNLQTLPIAVVGGSPRATASNLSCPWSPVCFKRSTRSNQRPWCG